MKHKALFFTSFALHLIYTYLRTKFSPSLAHCIVLKHDQASQSVPALPKFYRKCEKGVIMAATYRLFFTNEKAFFYTYKYFICLVVFSTSTDFATDKATCPLTPGYSTWQCLLFKQKDIATYHCTVFYLMLYCTQIIQAILQWYSFSVDFYI